MIKVWRRHTAEAKPADLSLGYPYFVTAIAVHGVYNLIAIVTQSISRRIMNGYCVEKAQYNLCCEVLHALIDAGQEKDIQEVFRSTPSKRQKTILHMLQDTPLTEDIVSVLQ